MIQPLLDNQVGLKNIDKADRSQLTITKEKALTLVKDTFISAAERDVATGDGIIINIITKAGIEVEHFPLRKDWLLYFGETSPAYGNLRVRNTMIFLFSWSILELTMD